jgi:hypothetical protein
MTGNSKTKTDSPGLKRWVLATAVVVSLLLGSHENARAQYVGCDASDAAFKSALEGLFEATKGPDQQRSASLVIDSVNTCPTASSLLDELFDRAEKAKDNQGVFKLASILNVSKKPWKIGNDAKQHDWEKKLYESYNATSNNATKAALNGALMNADGLYRQALGRIQTAKPGTDDFEAVRQGLQNTLQYPASLNYDDAKFLLAEFKIRELIAVRLGATKAPPADKLLAEARTFLGELIEHPTAKPPKYTMYGHWNLALLDLLTGNKEGSASRLEEMKKTYDDSLNVAGKPSWNHTLYYYRAFNYWDFALINNHITAGELYFRWKTASASWDKGRVFTASDGPVKLAAEIEKVFKDPNIYFVSLGVFTTPVAAQKYRDELISSGQEELTIYPPWAERTVYTVGTKLMTLANARKLLEASDSKLPKGSPITRFY